MKRVSVLLFTLAAFAVFAQDLPEPPGDAFAIAPKIAQAPRAPRPPRVPRSGENEEDRLYEHGQEALDAGHWDQALERFTEAAGRAGTRADGALYWKAYTQNKLGRRNDALSTIELLRKTYASSRWLDDAKALENEVKQASGQPPKPETETDEDLKLMAINGLLHSDPERAVPMLEKLLQSSQSPRLKDRALFVLMQSGSPRARQVVVQIATGKANPDLQIKAVHYLGVMGGRKELADIYAAPGDVNVKRAVLRAFMVSGAREQLFNAAKGEKVPELRREAVRQLGVMGSQSELEQLYQAESSAEIKKEIAHSLFIGGKAKALVDLARKENDMEVKKAIVRNLSLMRSKEATDYLMEILNK